VGQDDLGGPANLKDEGLAFGNPDGLADLHRGAGAGGVDVAQREVRPELIR
jgi:hypothetical protein